MSSSDLPVRAVVTWTSHELGDAHEIVILTSGWLRITWLNGVTSHVSPVAVRAVHGKGVSYGG